MTSDVHHFQSPVLLALRTLKLGDLLVAVPALKGLRSRFPEHRLVLAAPGWLAPIVSLIEAVDELLPTPGLDAPVAIPPGVVDIGVNLHGSGDESSQRVRELKARLTIDHSPRVPWIAELHERERWARLVNAFGAGADPLDVSIARPSMKPPVVGASVVHVGAFYGSRMWPTDRFARVARALHEAGHRVVLTGSSAERDRAREVAQLAGLDPSRVLAGRAGLEEFAAIMASARLLVSVDTGAAHLASAYAIPSVIIFGPAPPEIWGPPPGPHIVLTHAERRRGDTFAEEPDPALLAVTVDEVLGAAFSLD